MDPVQIALVVFAALLGWLFARWSSRERDDLDPYADADPETFIGRGVLLLEFAEKEELVAVATQKNILPNPAWIERGSSSEQMTATSGDARVLQRRREKRDTTDQREHLELPRDEGSLVKQVVSKLAGEYELNTELGSLPVFQIDEHSLLKDPDAAAEYVNSHLPELYEDGIDEPMESVVRQIINLLKRNSLERLVEQKRQEWDMVPPDGFVLVEGEWLVVSGDDSLVLALKNLEVDPRRPGHLSGEPSSIPKVLPMPSGLGISLHVPRAGLTNRGERLIGGLSTHHLGVFGTIEKHDAGNLRLHPIAVFSRLQGGRWPKGLPDAEGFIGGRC